MPKARPLKPGEKRVILKPGYQMRKPQGRDEEERVYRLQLSLSFEEYEALEEIAAEKGMGPKEWIHQQIQKRM